MATGTGAGHADFGEYAERKFYFRELRYCEVRRMDLPRTRIRNTGKRKAGPPWSGEYRLARLNEIVTRCNALINLCICCKWVFSSQRACALIPTWRGMGDATGGSPIDCEGQGRLEPCGIGPGICCISYVDFRELRLERTSENSSSKHFGE
jgi:hypothetical protein